jgi:cellulose biosynthesis protein BcsQ
VIRTAVSVINSKGGVGKTSIAANVAGLAAAAGWKVLVVDLDPQANMARELGYFDDERNDDGWALFSAMSAPTKAKLAPIEGVRPNLDVVPGGSHVAAAAELAKVWENQGRPADLVFYEALRPLAPKYQLILIDCPPGIRFLQNSALSASRFAVIPTKSDDCSLDGFSAIAERFEQVREKNPDLGLLGVVLFGFNSSAKRVIAEAREDIATGIGADDATFETIIRHAEAPARDARRRGLLMHEYTAAASQTNFWEALRGGGGDKFSRSDNLSQDYANLTKELLGRMSEALSAGHVAATA